MTENDGTDRLVKVVFDLPPGAPSQEETLWARPVGGDIFCLDNVPWYARGVALHDLVRCTVGQDAQARFVEVVKPSGNWTIRVFVPPGELRDAVQGQVCNFLLGLGCSYETYGPGSGLIAVTVPCAVERHQVIRELNELEREGQVYWESGNF